MEHPLAHPPRYFKQGLKEEENSSISIIKKNPKQHQVAKFYLLSKSE